MARPVKGRNGGTLHALEKGETANPDGRPPKLLSTIVSELRAQGYERASSANVVDAFETLLNVPEDVLAEMVKDKSKPMSLRIVGKAMLTAKGWEVLQAMLDRAHGRAKQSTDITTGGERITVTFAPSNGGQAE